MKVSQIINKLIFIVEKDEGDIVRLTWVGDKDLKKHMDNLHMSNLEGTNLKDMKGLNLNTGLLASKEAH